MDININMTEPAGSTIQTTFYVGDGEQYTISSIAITGDIQVEEVFE